ncbi:hypothetical protein CR164_11695 [Prosthecochloris marina]|uniref:Glycosyl transferase family 28 C-terminal domain-containing protein n=1 Tax=Prosthecochloris marina TaxID=2017681 RepID=A0A317T6V2_9CHLB|nr:glycosyltransferase [Prosthecochloris marina]PWW81196.1 hypothetical protein CR164_11695 [Prosthecochloris marina]
MIIGILGTCPYKYGRFIKIMEILNETIDDEIVIQCGSNKYDSKKIRFVEYFDRDEYGKQIKSAQCVISHAGFGVLNDCIKYKKRLIICPRSKKLNEHSDDHQIDLASNLINKSQSLKIIMPGEERKIIEYYNEVMLKPFDAIFDSLEKNRLIRSIKSYMKNVL